MTTTYNKLFNDMGKFSAAEEFFDYFSVPYEPAVVHINRLHILKRFHQYLRAEPGLMHIDDAALRATCRGLLTRAYNDFVHSSAQKEKVFKVFQDLDGSRVELDSLRATLPSQRNGA